MLNIRFFWWADFFHFFKLGFKSGPVASYITTIINYCWYCFFSYSEYFFLVCQADFFSKNKKNRNIYYFWRDRNENKAPQLFCTIPGIILNGNSPSEMFLGVLKICSKFTGKHPCQSTISRKLQNIFNEIALRDGNSLVNLLHTFRAPFLRNTTGSLLPSSWLFLFVEWFSFT